MGTGPSVLQRPPSQYVDPLKYESGRKAYSLYNTEVHPLPKRDSTNQRHNEPFSTLNAKLRQAASNHPDKLALRQEPIGKTVFNKKIGEKPPPALPSHEWKSWTWKQYLTDVTNVAKAALFHGLKVSNTDMIEAIGIWGFNSPEWLLSAYGAMMAGGIFMGIYPTDTVENVKFKINHSNASIICVDDTKKLDMLLKHSILMPNVKCIVVWGGADISGRNTSKNQPKVLSWEQFMKYGADQPDDIITVEATPNRCCCYIYTSGTTGTPKAVMLCHDNMIYSAAINLAYFNHAGVSGEERVVSYLPLSHIAGLFFDLLIPVLITAGINGKGHVSVSMARAYDLKCGSFGERLRAVKPTIFLGVPRIWEKIYEKMQVVGSKVEGWQKTFSDFCKGQGLAMAKNKQLGGDGSQPILYGLSNMLNLSYVKQALGFSELKVAVTGAAPISNDILSYFASIGVDICEVYGMSESSGMISVNYTNNNETCIKWGTVGCALQGVEVNIVDMQDNFLYDKNAYPLDENNKEGEIVIRGRNIMMGYLVNPNFGGDHHAQLAKKNKEAINAEGWLHTGDKGLLVNGMVKITGRFKEIIIGSGGENIAPVPIENNIKSLCPLISNCMMVGDQRKYNVCLITLKPKAPGSTDLSEDIVKFMNNEVTNMSQAMVHERLIKEIENAIKKTNSNPAICPKNASKIQKFTILPADFSAAGGEFTPTLKLKRSVTAKKYANIIEGIYGCKGCYFNCSSY